MFALIRTLSIRHLLQKWDRSLLIAVSIALGVTMFVSSRLLNKCTEAAARDTTVPVNVADLYVNGGEQGVDWVVADEIRKARIPGIKRIDRFVHLRVNLPKVENRTVAVFGIDISQATRDILRDAESGAAGPGGMEALVRNLENHAEPA